MPPRTRPHYSDEETSIDEDGEPCMTNTSIFKTKGSAMISFTSTSKVPVSSPILGTEESSVQHSSIVVSASVPKNRFDKYKEELKQDKREEYETSHDKDAKSILLKKHKLNKVLTGKEEVYLGANYYKSYLSHEDTVAGNATSQKYKYFFI